MLYRLSRFVPVRMRSRYGLNGPDDSVTYWRATWWQWRNRIYRHLVQPAPRPPYHVI